MTRRMRNVALLFATTLTYWGAPSARAAEPVDRRLTIEVGAGGASVYRRSVQIQSSTKATTEALALGAGVAYQWQLHPRIWCGPSLGAAAFHFGAQEVGGGAVTLSARGHLLVLDGAVFKLSLVVDAGPALSFSPEPRSFAIQHEVHPAPALFSAGGLRLGWTRGGRLQRWAVQAQFIGYWFARHPHAMTDSRTGERARETIALDRNGGLATFSAAF
jgi:hypothetical protein